MYPKFSTFQKNHITGRLLLVGFEVRIQGNSPALNCICNYPLTVILCVLCKHLSTYLRLQYSCAGYLNIQIISFYLKLPSFYFPLHDIIGQSVNFFKAIFLVISLSVDFYIMLIKEGVGDSAGNRGF